MYLTVIFFDEKFKELKVVNGVVDRCNYEVPKNAKYFSVEPETK